MTEVPPVELVQMSNEEWVVTIGETNLYLTVDYRGPKWWRFRLRDFHDILDPRTAWISVKEPGELRVSRNAKPIREVLKAEYRNKGSHVLELAIGLIQDNEEKWIPQEEETEKAESLDPEIEEEAEKILNDTNVLEALTPHLDNILIGEDDNKKLEFVLLLSGIVENPSLKQMVLLKAESGAGKSHLMRLADPFKTKYVGRFTAHALDYSNLENYQILKLKELGAMDEEFQGVSTIKFLSADDMGYIVETSIRDETGHFTTEQYRVPPITVITSTTRVVLDPQFERRAWILNPDESEEQTIRIAEWKANREHEKDLVTLGVLKETSYDHSMKVLGVVIRKLEPVKVILPFPRGIIKLIGSSKLRLRGDYDKFFALIRLYAFLHQRTFPKLNSKGKPSVIALPSKALEILQIAELPYQTMASGLEKRTRELVNVLEEMNIRLKGAVLDLTERGEIAVRLRKSERTIYQYFKDWENAGYMTSERTRGRGNPIQFQLLFDLDTIKKKTLVSFVISENLEVKRLELEKETREFLTSFPKSKGLEMRYILDTFQHGNGNTETYPICPPHVESLNNIPQPPDSNFGKEDTDNTDSIQEKKETTSRFQGIAETEKPVSEKGSIIDRAFSRPTHIISVVALDEPEEGICCRCQRQVVLYHQIEDTEGHWGLVGQDCGEDLMKRLRRGES